MHEYSIIFQLYTDDIWYYTDIKQPEDIQTFFWLFEKVLSNKVVIQPLNFPGFYFYFFVKIRRTHEAD